MNFDLYGINISVYVGLANLWKVCPYSGVVAGAGQTGGSTGSTYAEQICCLLNGSTLFLYWFLLFKKGVTMG